MIFQGCGDPNCPCVYFSGKSMAEIERIFSGEDHEAMGVVLKVLVTGQVELVNRLLSVEDSVNALSNKVQQLSTNGKN